MTDPSDLSADETERDPDWLTTPEAAAKLSVSVPTVRDDQDVRTVIEHKSAGAASPQGVGWLWSRIDIERLIAFRDRFGLRTRTAARALQRERNSGQKTEFADGDEG